MLRSAIFVFINMKIYVMSLLESRIRFNQYKNSNNFFYEICKIMLCFHSFHLICRTTKRTGHLDKHKPTGKSGGRTANFNKPSTTVKKQSSYFPRT